MLCIYCTVLDNTVIIYGIALYFTPILLLISIITIIVYDMVTPEPYSHTGPHNRIGDKPHKLMQVNIIIITDKFLLQLLYSLFFELDY